MPAFAGMTAERLPLFLLIPRIQNALGLALAAAIRPFHQRILGYEFDRELEAEV
jgi:hypothetical protein